MTIPNGDVALGKGSSRSSVVHATLCQVMTRVPQHLNLEDSSADKQEAPTSQPVRPLKEPVSSGRKSTCSSTY